MVSRQWARIFLNYSLYSRRRRAVSFSSVLSGGSVLGLCSPRFREVLHLAVAQKGLQFCSSWTLNYEIPMNLIKSIISLLQMGMQWESSNITLRWHNRGHGQSPSLSQDKMWRGLLTVLCFLSTTQNLWVFPPITVLREIPLLKFLCVWLQYS